MENAINNTAKIDLVALAAEVIAKLTAVHDGLADLEKVSLEIAEATDTAYHNHERGTDRPFCMVSGDFWLAKAILDGVQGVREKIVHPRFRSSGAIEAITQKIADREEQYARAEEDRIREAEMAARQAVAMAREANAEAAEKAERIVSDFLKISGTTKMVGKGRFKRGVATVVFLFNGNVYEVESDFDKATLEFSGVDHRNGRQGYLVIDRRELKAVPLFKPEMTAEEIGKTAHALDCIRAALREVAGPVAAPAVEEVAA
ncbi:hypothetical protein G8E10_24930 [Rhizobiaceae bacterium CRRU44]|uniref:Uncharacterized protein n=1 Tax=Ferranicluibacter rubi TaxID=2715133 RepID=A0AA44CD78_9HYPH|nr:hypothetical protein [Ferranicluibacter rubi]NHT78948.1 hypothetical protein [Ferranicluibacter rubi]